MSGFGHAPSSVDTSPALGQLASASASSSSSAAVAPTFAGRVSDFVERNRKAVYVAAGVSVVVAGAAGWYYYQQRSSSSSLRPRRRIGDDGADAAEKDIEEGFGGDGGDGEEAASPTAQRKKSKKKKSKKNAGAATGASQGQERSNTLPATVTDDEASENDPLNFSELQLASMPVERRRQIAGELKTKGNKAYSAKRYQEAIDIYTKAIQCDEQAVYYSNRAACHTNLNQHQEVIKDCTDALRLDPAYVKALNRRGQAKEALGGEDNLFQSLCDFTAGAIIDGFTNDSMAKAVDRVMKLLASERAATIMKDRQPRLPSPTFIKAYMEAFRPRDRPERPADPVQAEETLFLAFDALEARDYTHAFSLFNESVDQGIPNKKLKSRALNMTGTFKFILGDANAALQDLNDSTALDPDYTQTWVKKASVHMELANPELAFESFETAIRVSPEDPDIYYHRGQVYFITGQYDAAIGEYRRSVELDNAFVFSHIQLAVALYKSEQAEKALHMFKKIIKDFGKDCPEVYNYYGEILLDRGQFTDAADALDKSIALEKSLQVPRGQMNVLPMVNKALCLFQSKRPLEEAEALCRDALALDPGCDIAVATLGQLLLQQNKIREAVTIFAKSAEIARTEIELQSALAYETATRAQLDFIEKYPEYAHKLGLAQARM